MKTYIKRSLIIIALALVAGLAYLVWLGSRPDEPDEPVGASVSETSGGPSFEVRVIMPRLGLPLGGLLPDWLVTKLDGTPRELRFDHTSRGAQIRSVEHNRIELVADGWELFIETDGSPCVGAFEVLRQGRRQSPRETAQRRDNRRARTAASDKPCKRDMLIARSLHHCWGAAL